MQNLHVKKIILLLACTLFSASALADSDPIADAYLKDIDTNSQVINSSTAGTNSNTAAISSSTADIDTNSLAIAQTLTDTNTSDQTIWSALYWIEQFTYMIFVDVNTWILQDTSKTTIQLQGLLTNFVNAFTTNLTAQNHMQTQINNEVFGSSGGTNTAPTNINDLTYTTFLNTPYFSPDPRSTNDTPYTPQMAAYAYTKNASAVTIPHLAPQNTWTGRANDQVRYSTAYNTVMAVQSFNAYVLSQLYSEYNDGSPLTTAQTNLITMASGSSWFATVASENIGYVLRQLLMFSSQEFVLLNQLYNTENKLLEVQAMTNSLLIVQNMTNEGLLITRASGQVK